MQRCETHELLGCDYCKPKSDSPDYEANGAALEAKYEASVTESARQAALAARPQCSAQIVPVPSTAILPKDGFGHMLPRSDKPRHDVLTTYPKEILRARFESAGLTVH